MENNSLTPEELAQQNADLKATNEKLTQTNSELSTANSKLTQDNTDLKAANKKLTQDNKTLQTEAQKVVKALSTNTVVEFTPTKVEAPKLPTQRVSFGQKEYAFQVPVFYFNGFYYTAEEIVADSDSEAARELFGKLISTEGQGILKEVK